MKSFTTALVLLGAWVLDLGHAMAENFTQPILWQDLADTDLIRVNDTYYYSASNMHFSPGAPILRSYDLVNWEYFSHSVPVLDFGDKFSLTNGNAYNAGVYASTLRYRNSTGLFYWIGCMQGTGKTYVYTSPKIEGPWKQTSVISDYCYYDCGLLIDDDDQMYVAYGKWLADGANAVIWVAQLTKDGLKNAKVQQIFHSNSAIGYIEGARFYKKNGKYYVMLTNPGIGEGELILKSSGGPMGPYDSWHQILKNNGNPVAGASHPYQGALIDTPKGDWYYIAFVNRFPGGRNPVLAPVTWDSQGWPNVQFTGGGWGSSYAYPLPKHPVKTVTGTETFNSTTLGPQFEWNHNPDNTKWSTGKGLTLQTATKTDDFFVARNTLSHRALGPKSVAEIELDVSGMIDGDTAGLAIFRYDAAWIGVSMSGSTKSVQMTDGVLMSSSGSWKTTNKGSVIASKALSGNSVWLRCSTDISGSPGYATFQYSTDGSSYTSLGQQHKMADGAIFFVGDRWGIFNFATKNLGGKVVIKSFKISQ
jgi:beta-xylosidase